jgi:hypothetical protein
MAALFAIGDVRILRFQKNSVVFGVDCSIEGRALEAEFAVFPNPANLAETIAAPSKDLIRELKRTIWSSKDDFLDAACARIRDRHEALLRSN